MAVPRNDPVDLWIQWTDRFADREYEQAVELLSAAEHARWQKLIRERNRREYAAAHALVRRALSARTGRPPASWTFRSDEGGKPCIDTEDCDLRFNMAHTDGLVACAIVRTGEIGIDVETIDRIAQPMDIAARHFSEREVRDLLACSAAERRTRFIELWTLKEAWLKATGTGLRSHLGDFAFEWVDPAGLRFIPPPTTAPGIWRFLLLAPGDRHRLALAIHCTGPVHLHVMGEASHTTRVLPVLRASVPD
jgi:4'-phosphopantetheinyl transferase